MEKEKTEEFQKRVMSTLRAMKYEFHLKPKELIIPILQEDNIVAQLKPVSSQSFTVPDRDVQLITQWRNKNYESFFTWFVATEEGTRKWLEDQVIKNDDKILFMIQTIDSTPFGHLGLSNFDFSKRACELDNVVRGEQNVIPGGITLALKALLTWIFTELNFHSVVLRVFSDNKRAISLYERGGFHILKEVPLLQIEEKSSIRWVEAESVPEGRVERSVSYMEACGTATFNETTISEVGDHGCRKWNTPEH